MTLVSLFAGIGGFDLGFERAGFTPVGMCEIDPHARSVLDHHWPTVPKHDDVTTLRGSTFGPADVVTFGSPCQDLSVAGKRAGLEGERSGLFLEAMRYIREMLEETNGQYPRAAIWENVPGAFSSNGGADFAAVLASMVGGTVRRPTDGWANAGVAFGPEGAAEWRVLDAQHFGVAQRRRRVFVIYHPGGERAGQVLLECQSLRGNPQASRSPGQSITGALTGGAGSGSAGNVDDNRAQAGFVVPVLNDQGGSRLDISHGVTGTLRAEPKGNHPLVASPLAFKVRGGKEGGGKGYLGSEDKALTLSTVQEQFLAEPIGFDHAAGAAHGMSEREGTAPTLQASSGIGRAAVAFPIQDGRAMNKDQNGSGIGSPLDPSYTLDATGAQAVAFALRGREEGAVPEVTGDQASALRGAPGGSSRDYVAFDLAQITSKPNRARAEPGLPAGTLAANSDPRVASGYAVRRLTPTECERLQGFPDGHTQRTADGAEIADTNRYRMLGNAVTVSVAEWIGNRLIAELRAQA